MKYRDPFISYFTRKLIIWLRTHTLLGICLLIWFFVLQRQISFGLRMNIINKSRIDGMRLWPSNSIEAQIMGCTWIANLGMLITKPPIPRETNSFIKLSMHIIALRTSTCSLHQSLILSFLRKFVSQKRRTLLYFKIKFLDSNRSIWTM